MTDERENASREAEGQAPLGVRQVESPSTRPSDPFAIDLVLASADGWLLLEGWIDDSFDPIAEIRIAGSASGTFPGPSLGRRRRILHDGTLLSGDLTGFLGLTKTSGLSVKATGDFEITVVTRSGRAGSVITRGQVASRESIRNRYLLSLPLIGGGQDNVLPFLHLEQGAGQALLSINREIVSDYCSAPYVSRFDRRDRTFRASIIVCIFGRAEYLFIQAALFSSAKVCADFEFIYVCNSPELGEILLSEAAIASELYDLAISVVLLPGNAGFAAANNTAATFARSPRLIFVNPDVFPKDNDWALKHDAVIAELPPPQTRLFGAVLYYEDGSLMHGGMYLAADNGVTFSNSRTLNWRLLRVEHFGKGAPPTADQFTTSRVVPAVSGAFISVDRAWFDQLGGFSIDFMLGHYEDADLCLRSAAKGAPPWLHDLKLWHLEGEGSSDTPQLTGSAVINRWLFSARWAAHAKERQARSGSEREIVTAERKQV